MLKSTQLARWVVLIATLSLAGVSATTLTGCGDDENTTGDEGEEGPDITPQVRFTGLDVSPSTQGAVPFATETTVTLTTADPRAEVVVRFDFGDGEATEETTRTSLTGVYDPEDPAELEAETRTVSVSHTYDDPSPAGGFELTFMAVDVTSSARLGLEQTGGEVDPGVCFDPGAPTWCVKSRLETETIVVDELTDLVAFNAGPVAEVGAEEALLLFDQELAINYRILIANNDLEASFRADFYLVSRQDLTRDELQDPSVAVPVGEVVLGPLGKDRAHEGQHGFTLDSVEDFDRFTEGTWYPAILVDPLASVDEEDEDNNFRVADVGFILRGEGALADLVVVDSVLPNERFIANAITSTERLSRIEPSFSVKNTGEQEAPAAGYQVYLSQGDDTLEPGGEGAPIGPGADLLLGAGTLAPLAGGESERISGLRFDIDEIVAVGDYYVIVVLDAADEVDESSVGEENNVVASPQAITVTGVSERDVDIATTGISVSPSSTYLGGQFNVSFDVANVGEDTAGQFRCRIYLSNDGQFDQGSDLYLLETTTESLNPGASQTIERTILVPVNNPLYMAGVYQTFALCDARGEIEEPDEANNLAGPSAPITINANPLIDFAIQSATVDTTTVDVDDPSNDTLTITAEVCNVGSDAGAPPLVEAFLSGDDLVEPSDLSLGYEAPTGQVAPGACVDVTLVKKASCLTFSSVYNLFLVLDPDDDVVEVDETNNWTHVADAGGTPAVITVGGAQCTCVEDSLDVATPNNTPQTATLLPLAGTDYTVDPVTDERSLTLDDSVGLALCGSSSSGEADVFEIPLNVGDQVSVTLTHAAADGDLDLRLHAGDPASPTVVDTASSVGSDTEVVSHGMTATGSVFVEVLPRLGGDSNYYSLDVHIIPSPTDPDFTIDGFNLISGPAPSDLSAYEAELTVSNEGIASGSPNVIVYLSDSPTFNPSSPPTRIIPGSEVQVTLGAQETVDIVLPAFDFFELWPGIPTGDYYLIAVIDHDEQIVEFDENNNVLASSAIHVSTDCLPDALEGGGNDTVADATLIEVSTSGFTRYEDLNICDNGRDDFYKVCVPANGAVSLNHIGGLQDAPDIDFEVEAYEADGSTSIDINWTSSRPAAAVGVGDYTCADDADCFGDEMCNAQGYCEDPNTGLHCNYFEVRIWSSSSETTFLYDLVVDTAAPEFSGEPLNDERATPEGINPRLRTLASDADHATVSDDEDWYAIDLTAGTEFTINYEAVDGCARLQYFVGESSSSAATLDGYETRTVTVATDATYFFRVYNASSSDCNDSTQGYVLELEGIEGTDLVPMGAVVSPSSSQKNGQTNVTWDLVNQRFTPTVGAVPYRYILSRDTTVDLAEDYLLRTLTPTASSGPISDFETIQQKVYFQQVDPTTGSVSELDQADFGDFYLIIDVNPADDMGAHPEAEVDYTNNTLARPVQLAHVCEADSNDMSGGNDTPGSATNVMLMGGVYDSAELLSVCASDDDYYALNIPAGATYRFTIDQMVQSSVGDLDLYLFDPAIPNEFDPAALLAFSTSASSTSESFEYTNTGGTPMSVRLKVEAFQPTHTNVYHLMIEEVP